MKFKNELKRKNSERAKSGPRLKPYCVRRPTAAVGHHGLTARLARPRSHSTRPARALRGARAPSLVTARWPRARRQASMAGGIQPDNKVWVNRWGQLAQEKGKVQGKVGPAGMHRGGGATTGRRGRLWMAVFRWRGGSGYIQGPQQLHRGERRGEGVAPIGAGWHGSMAQR
jgi:hypothetical protein